MGAVTIDDAILTALRAHTTLTLAYTDADGPQACAVLYAVTGEGSLVFVTSPTTRHGRGLAADPRAAFTVQADGQRWTELTGVQGRGLVRRLPDQSREPSPERAAAWAAYTQSFPFVTADERLGAALAATALWELRPSWLRLIDNARGFGAKTEWSTPVDPLRKG
ncbi:pyridoxamine 5'-phosphate oxidase family protein [Streptacidiphilus neutrinimicus]|uniref:pyridoxamine 5'-phosphate oxidase family protein n=1 Tax=Streptacidiphilus neutrinimicus TaxID=105420 RepID=UPI0005AA526C|nr:pyridoxamine 5'-phosphate oxidase family protein [Streptacidiphilus neutrinimicus]